MREAYRTGRRPYIRRYVCWIPAAELPTANICCTRKSGIHLALAVQNPTWQSLDLGIRRNCTPLTFRVNGGDASRVILNTPGAEALGNRQFLTVMGGLERGVAFAPGDAVNDN